MRLWSARSGEHDFSVRRGGKAMFLTCLSTDHLMFEASPLSSQAQPFRAVCTGWTALCALAVAHLSGSLACESMQAYFVERPCAPERARRLHSAESILRQPRAAVPDT